MDDPYGITEALSDADEYIVVSDGSSRRTQMAQGWVLAIASGRVLAEGGGPASGTAWSHRAEGFGMNAATLFLALLQSYTGRTLGPCQIFCDNAGLVSTIQDNQEYVHTFPNQFLKADRDQVNSILHNLSQLADPEVEHVKGHQDENAGELNVPAKLNVRADALAGWYDLHHPRRHYRTPVNSHSKAQLHIRGKTVSNNYRQHIRNAIHGPAYHHHLCT